MTDKLTSKQAAFAMAYIETGNASEAYRMSYDVAADTTESSIWVSASKVKNNDKVALRIEELNQSSRKRHGVTIDSLTDELETARKAAQEAGQASAMVAAIMGKAKLHGLLTDKAQIRSPDESMRPTTIVLVGEPMPDDTAFH